jgi:hypothetical protein
MDRLLDLSNNSMQYGNSICPSMIRKLKEKLAMREKWLYNAPSTGIENGTLN